MRRLVLVAAVLLCTPTGADAAARTCAEPAPGALPERVTPQQAAMNRERLDLALHALQDRRSYAIRVLRHGCLVAEDTNTAATRTAQYEGWELTSAVVGMLAGRAMELGLLDPDEPVGAFLPQADRDHGALRVGDLLARGAGLQGEPDDVALPDRLRRALLRPVGPRSFGDAPTGSALVVAAVQRAVGADLQAFAARELFGPLGIVGGQWAWTRDDTGLTDGSFGLQMTADAWVRIGELLRRDGVWRGRRLLPAAYLRRALGPSPQNPCLGWHVWNNDRQGCSGTPHRLLGGAPPDVLQLRGRFDQRVTLIPSLGLTIVRTGTTAADSRSADDAFTWERGNVLAFAGAVTDRTFARTANEPAVLTDGPFRDFSEPPGTAPRPLPPAGPARARAVRVDHQARMTGRRRVRVQAVVRCPPVALRSCAGSATLVGATAPAAFALAPGGSATLRFRLPRRNATPGPRTLRAEVRDDVGTTATEVVVDVRR